MNDRSESRRPSESHRKVLQWVVIVLGIVGSIAIYFMVPPSVSSTLARNADGTLHLEVRKNFRVNSIMDISLCVDGEEIPIWETAFKPTPVPAATIDLHGGGTADEGQMARSIRDGERFSIRVHYQFDSAIPPAACSGGQQFHFTMGTGGRPEYAGTNDW